jgi:serine/threonine-protein kinase
MLAPGDRIADRYVVEALAGRGGMAVVYRVQHAQLGSTHALKLLAMKTKGMTRRLEQEGRIQARLRHPNILQVTDLVEHEGQVGLVMEWVESPALDDWLATNGPLPVEAALGLFAPVLSAVAAAHDLGILHRDLKPANIMLARGIGGYVPKVADFGIAKMVMDDAPSRTVGGMPMGTPGYMAPEQIRSAKDVDVRADVFSLGAVLYSILTGKPPFEADEPFEAMEDTLAGKYAPLDGALPDCPPRVVAAVHRSLDPDPDKRFRDVRALGKELFADRPDLLSLFEPDSGTDELRIDRTGSFPSLSSGGNGATRPAQNTVALPTAIPPLTQPGPMTTGGGGASRAVLGIAALGALAVFGLLGVLVVGGVLLYPKTLEQSPAPEPVPVAVAPSPPSPAPVEAPIQVAEEPPMPAPAPVESPEPAAAPRPASIPGTAPAPAPIPSPVEVAEPVAPEPVPAPAPVAAPAPAPEPVAAPAPAAVPPMLSGEWKGKANNQPMTLKFISQSGTSVEASVTFTIGPTSRTVRLHGRVMPDGSLSLAGDDGGPLSFSGRVVDESASGKYSRNNGKMLDWNATR